MLPTTTSPTPSPLYSRHKARDHPELTLAAIAGDTSAKAIASASMMGAVRGVTSFIVTAGDKARGRRSGDTGTACMWILYWERAFL